MKLTKIKALQLCEEMWRWLAGHPSRTKVKWIEKFSPYKSVKEECFACQYYIQQNGSLCQIWLNTVTTFNAAEPLNSILTARQKAQLLIHFYLEHEKSCDFCQIEKEETHVSRCSC